MMENYPKVLDALKQYQVKRGWESVSDDQIEVFLVENTITIGIYDGKDEILRGMCKDKKGKQRWHGSLYTTDYSEAKKTMLDIAYKYLESRL